MIKHAIAGVMVLGAIHLAPGPLPAQSPPGPGGHWEGAITTPGQEIVIAVDLFPGAGDAWEGTISVPAQNVTALPLADITVKGEAVGFAMPRMPGDPRFAGTLAGDGKTLSGDFTQGGATMPFALTWKGEAQRPPPARNTAITSDLAGAWEGTLDINGTSLRLVLKLANADGSATGTIVSVDQGGAEIALSSIVQEGTHFRLEARTIAGAYEGDVKEGRLTGTWTQGPGSWPLEFRRPQP